MWHIYIARNSAVFKLYVPHPNSTINKLLNDISNANRVLQATRKEKEVVVPYVNPTWRLPKRGLYKLNTDASWRKGKAAGGGVVRGDAGSWVAGFSIKLNCKSAKEAELLTVRQGLEFMKELQIKNFELEVDAKKIRDIFEDGEDYTHHAFRPILKDIAQLMQVNEGLEIVHIPRQNNTVAHGLACFAMKMKEKLIVHRTPPQIVRADYESDVRAVTSN